MDIKQVMWFFANEDGNIIAQVSKAECEEEQAIDELSLMVPHGRYILGYFRSDGTKKLYENARQIV